MSDFDRTIAAVAAQQHQVITFADVTAAGGTHKHVEARLSAGRWESFRDNVYRLAGIPWTFEATARTVLDTAGRLKLTTSVVRLIEQGRRAELLDWSDLAAVLATHARKGRPGVTRLREAIAAGYTENEATDAELLAFSLLKQHGFPEPVVHHRIYEPDRRIAGEIDLAYVERKRGLEIDGPVHQDPVVMMRDHERDDYLREAFGWRIRRIWYRIPIDQPAKFIRIVRETLR